MMIDEGSLAFLQDRVAILEDKVVLVKDALKKLHQYHLELMKILEGLK